MAHEFAADDRSIKLSGEVENDAEYQHGDVIYVVGRAVVHEVSFPEDRHSNVKRVHRAQFAEVTEVDAQDAEKLLAFERERRTGQGDLLAEITRNEEV
jgi:hypothetical protein